MFSNKVTNFAYDANGQRSVRNKVLTSPERVRSLMQIEFRFCLIECFGVAFSCKAPFTNKYHTESFYL